MATDNTVNRDLVITEALKKLEGKEYRLEFRREATCLYCIPLREWIMPEDFTVDEYYYFEDILNPDEERMLYAISLASGPKGFLVDACNVYTDNISPAMMQKLELNKIRKRKNDLANAGQMKRPGSLFNDALTF